MQNICANSDDLIVLRMNAEGVEKEIIDCLVRATDSYPKINGLFGSLGDVRKCFGEEAEKNALKALEQLKIPYVYFTSSPRSWRLALEELARMAD